MAGRKKDPFGGKRVTFYFTSIYSDSRYADLVLLKNGSQREAKALLLEAYERASLNWIEYGGVPQSRWEDDYEDLIKSGFAEVRKVRAEKVLYIRGSEKAFDYITSQWANAQVAKQRREIEKQQKLDLNRLEGFRETGKFKNKSDLSRDEEEFTTEELDIKCLDSSSHPNAPKCTQLHPLTHNKAKHVPEPVFAEPELVSVPETKKQKQGSGSSAGALAPAQYPRPNLSFNPITTWEREFRREHPEITLKLSAKDKRLILDLRKRETQEHIEKTIACYFQSKNLYWRERVHPTRFYIENFQMISGMAETGTDPFDADAKIDRELQEWAARRG